MATTAAPAVAGVPVRSSNYLAVAGIAGLGAAATVVAVWALWGSSVVRSPETTAVVKGLLITGYVGVGAYTWWRRPQSRLGLLVAAAGFLYALTALVASTDPWVFSLGRLSLAVLIVYFAYLFLCFPSDRLGSELERRLVAAFAAASAAIWAFVLLVAHTLPHGGAFSDCDENCPTNPFQVVDGSHSVTRAVNLTANALTALALAAVIALLVRKARFPAHLRRRAVVPLLWAAIALTATYAAYSVLTEAGTTHHITALRIASAVAALAVPLALLVGQVRGRIFAATNLWQVLASTGSQRLTPRWVEEILRSSLGDPSFALGVWEPERSSYVDSQGAPLELPESSRARTVTQIHQDGRPALALIHDPALADEPEVVDGLGATALLLLENARLVDQLQASRARIVESAERERLRLERDLHDGAQQRLMAIQIKLALAREAVGDGQLGEQLDELASDASAAVEELRALAHGIYPTVLRERGLAHALKAFARAVPIPVVIVDDGVSRATSGVEVAIYYCSLEAIQNAVKHAGPDARVTVTLGGADGRIDFAVEDDGIGFDPAASSDGVGLVNMRDRIAAVGGELLIDSLPGRGTSVSGTVPDGQMSHP
jgi:signal transduction histidine kinase